MSTFWRLLILWSLLPAIELLSPKEAMEVLQALYTFIFDVPLSLADRVLEENPHLKYALVPVGCILTAAVAAWVVIPLLLKYYHNESIIFSEVTPWRPFPYEASYWGALEDPLRFLIGYFALSLAGYLIAPLTVENYVLPIWKGVVMASFVLFLHKCRRSAIAQVLAVVEKTELDQKSLNTVDILLSTAIFGLGLLALAAAVGVSTGDIILIMHYIILIIVLGEWVVNWLGWHLIRNVCAGYILLTSKSLEIGDIVKTKSGIEGQVVEIGVTTTLLLVERKLPVVLPNSEVYLPMSTSSSSSSQAMVAKIPLQIADYYKIHLIAKDMESMLLAKSKVILEVPPYCFPSRIEKPNAQLVLGCNLEYMTEEELVSVEQDIIHEAGEIIRLHNATNPKHMTIRFFRKS